jgi:uncharacterized alpha-E superfamily protein
VFSLLDQLNIGLLSFSEMCRQCMYRGQSRTMYRMGQVIEELLMELTLFKSLLSTQYDESVEFQLLETLLLTSQNLSTYRSVYRTSIDIAPALDLLFLNNQNPTSLSSQLEGLLKYSRSLPQKEDAASDNEVSRLVLRLITIDKLIENNRDTGRREALDAFCENLHEQISSLSTKLSANYFNHSTYQQQGSKNGFQFEV